MIALIQRVNSASVKVSNKTISKINSGILILLGIRNDDGNIDVDYLASRIESLKIMQEGENHFAKNLIESNSQIMLVSQFTLYANLKKGSKPSFTDAMNGKDAKILYHKLGRSLEDRGYAVSYGEFGALMQVELINDGPVTFILTSDHLKDKNKELID